MGRIAREVLLCNVGIQNTSQFSIGMKVIKKAYTHQYNTRHKRFGPVWRDRYKTKLIENEAYLNVCGNYVENNPVEAGMVEKAIDWPHSSSRYYELGEHDSLVDVYDHVQGQPEQTWKNEEFEKMKVLGSDLFQYRLHKRLKN